MCELNICRKGAKDAKLIFKKCLSLCLCGGSFASAVLVASVWLVSATAQAASTQDLQRFFNQVQRYSARFDQVVLDEKQVPIQESSGQLWIERPGKFRWQYASPYEQQIVGDGKQVWVYDVELKQVAVRRMEGALGATPAMLLAGRGNLETVFTIRDLGTQGKFDWVQMKPKTNEGGFNEIRIGFEGSRIRTLEMVDGFGQTTRVTLLDGKENAAIPADKFTFKAPKGVDVITE